MRAVVLVWVLAPLLAGCGIPDLVAHTVKAVEKSQREPASSAAAPTAVPAPATAESSSQDRIEEAPAPAPAYTPSSRSGGGGGGITVEELPPR
ncbi:hypothetical protein [Magnetospirillum fulvum]|uniref:hypothetical protein n=1 Tax=Magnetospirillum fulvum TaxID=1082 RepID=UPI0011150659|nr:hypothetical protein [Magnetospirillum fulvum]